MGDFLLDFQTTQKSHRKFTEDAFLLREGIGGIAAQQGTTTGAGITGPPGDV